MATYAQQLFETISLETIDDFIRDNQEENLHLDFKLSTARMSKDDRRTLAKVLSGFANADGGVIVWGVDAAPNAEGIDCARAKQPISPLSQFMSQLTEFTGAAANPTVDGVMHRRIDVGADTGYALTLVPASDSGPHMAKLGEDRYYKRSGSRFAKMEHFDLEDMFGRRQRPVLEVVYRIEETSTGSGRRYFRVVLGLANRGRGTAKSPYLGVDVTNPGEPNNGYAVFAGGLSSGRAEHVLMRMTSNPGAGSRMVFIGTADLVIHPGMSFDVAGVQGSVVVANPRVQDLTITCRIAAENFRLTTNTFTVPENEVLEALRLRR